MKIKPLQFSNNNRRFYVDKICVTEQDVNILASDRNYELNIEIFIDNIIHFQITDESCKVKFSEYLFENKEKNNWDGNPTANYFFEIIDDSYMDWLKEESFDFFEKKYYKAYIFFFSDSVIEVISSTEPVFYSK
ncbi:hypothetical protein [Neisseria basseii]|uniref:hypothetical protein n=1 Tax=Neisseria basseii TaxID=2830650 RepID=UPI0026593881|nr:hypothetical protein [Neisseria basseii]